MVDTVVVTVTGDVVVTVDAVVLATVVVTGEVTVEVTMLVVVTVTVAGVVVEVVNGDGFTLPINATYNKAQWGPVAPTPNT